MGRFNLDDYSPVEERLGLFYEEHPDGRIFTAIERLEPPLVVFRAEVYRDAVDTEPWATGYAYEKEGEGHVNATSYIENCETSAIGRALANAGYHGRREGAPRPSREEMQKVERMGGTPAERKMYEKPSTPVGVKESHTCLDQTLTFGKHKGRTWRELLVTLPDYVEWAVDNMDRLAPEAKDELRFALAAHRAAVADLTQPEPDLLPF